MKITLVLLISLGLCLIVMVDSRALKPSSITKGRQNNEGANVSGENEDDDDEDDGDDDFDDALDSGDDDDEGDEEEDNDESDDDDDDDDDDDYLERVLDDFVTDDDDEDDDEDDEDYDDDSDGSSAPNPQQLPVHVQQDLADPSNIVYDDTEDFAAAEYSPIIDPNNDDAVRIPSRPSALNAVTSNNDDDEDDDEEDYEDDFISDEAIEARDSTIKNLKRPITKSIKTNTLPV